MVDFIKLVKITDAEYSDMAVQLPNACNMHMVCRISHILYEWVNAKKFQTPELQKLKRLKLVHVVYIRENVIYYNNNKKINGLLSLDCQK